MLQEKSVFLRNLGTFDVPGCGLNNISAFDLGINGIFSERYKDWKLKEEQKSLPAYKVNIREMVPDASFRFEDLYDLYVDISKSSPAKFYEHMLEENRIVQILEGKCGEDIPRAIGDNARERLFFFTVPNGWPKGRDNAFAFEFSYDFDPGNHATGPRRDFYVHRFNEETSINRFFKTFFLFKV